MNIVIIAAIVSVLTFIAVSLVFDISVFGSPITVTQPNQTTLLED